MARMTKAKIQSWLNARREEELREYDYRFSSHKWTAIINVPLSFSGNHIKPMIRGHESGQGWIWLLSYWDVDFNAPFVRLGLFQGSEKEDLGV